MNPPDNSELGHGDHWGALLGDQLENVMPLVEESFREAISIGQFPPPWPGSDFAEVMLFEREQFPVAFTTLIGRSHDGVRNELLSAFPAFTVTEEWIVRIDSALASYGPHEGLMEGELAHGAPLRWFAPRFGIEREQWLKGGVAHVALAALALQIQPFKAEPIIVRSGDMVETERRRLRDEGRVDEANDPALSVTVTTDQLRMFTSSGYDNHEFVGRVERVRPIQPRPGLCGWIIDLEIVHDQPVTGWVIPLYVFTPAAGDYLPKSGDLVQGVAWVQGRYIRLADESEQKLWHPAPF